MIKWLKRLFGLPCQNDADAVLGWTDRSTDAETLENRKRKCKRWL